MHSPRNPPVSTGHAEGITLRGILNVNCMGEQQGVAVTVGPLLTSEESRLN